MSVPSRAVGFDWNTLHCQEVGIVVCRDPDEHPGLATCQPRLAIPRIFERVPNGLEKYSLLRIHCVGCSPTSKSRCWEIPSTQRRFADQILSRVEMFPERIEIGRARKYPAHPDDRDRLHLGIRT